MSPAEIVGAISGVAGAVLVTSTERRWRFMAFCLWIISNILIISVLVSHELYTLLCMQCVYLLTSLLGAYNTRPLRK